MPTVDRPNILFLMTDQMQGRVLDPDSPCRTPCFDALAARGVRITRAYTPNPVCSPARASLMTGLQPHSHNVLQVTHCMPNDVANLRTDHPHWAQTLQAAGYETGYFGKWHVERTESPGDFGWGYDCSGKSANFGAGSDAIRAAAPERRMLQSTYVDGVPGYPPQLLYGVTEAPLSERSGGITTTLALDWLEGQLDAGRSDVATEVRTPWCCFVSINEPHDPFVCGAEAYASYDPDTLPVPANWDDALADRPGLYRKSARTYRKLSERQKREAAACYYATITEIDAQYQRLIDRLEAAGELDNTLIVLTSDHGEFLGGHGLYTKNIGAFEEAYHIPMILAGANVPAAGSIDARVGLHDLGSTLVELAGAGTFATPESRSFVPLLSDPKSAAPDFQTGYAEYYGGRYWISQRVIWDGDWKLVWNGFDDDELYNLREDPSELCNRIHDPAAADQVRALMARAWRFVADTDDHPLGRSNYMSLHLAPIGPLVAKEPVATPAPAAP